MLFYCDRVAPPDFGYTSYVMKADVMEIIEKHLAELHIDGVDLRTHHNWYDLIPSAFCFQFYSQNNFMNWDEEMGFYLEHTTNS
jgi:hypothetical protein